MYKLISQSDYLSERFIDQKDDYYTTQNKTNFKGTFGIHKTLGPSKAFSSPGFGGNFAEKLTNIFKNSIS